MRHFLVKFAKDQDANIFCLTSQLDEPRLLVQREPHPVCVTWGPPYVKIATNKLTPITTIETLHD